MATSGFGSSIWGGGAPVPSGSVGVLLSSMIERSYRIAGITKWVGTSKAQDWIDEAIAELNAMVGGLNCNRLNIFTVRIDSFPITSGQKIFTIGNGADFDMPRPQKIEQGVIILGNPNTPGVVRMPPMYQMNDGEWSYISLQDIPNGVPLSFYYDGSYDTATGFSLIYLWTQTTNSYWVEWYTWQSLQKFQTKSDVFALPDGYEDAFVYLLAERLAGLNPHMAKMAPNSYVQARRGLKAIQKLNAPAPKLFVNDAGNVGQAGRGLHWDYRIGSTR